jgi:hypothetical protein
MDLFNRLVVTALAAAAALGGGFVLVAVSGAVTAADLQQAPGLAPAATGLQALQGTDLLQTGAAGGLAVLAGLLLLFLEVRSPRRGRELLVGQDKLGAVTVSLAGLRRLAEHVVGEVPGVEAVAPEARLARGAVRFRCRVVIAPETNAPELAEEIRTRLSEAVRNHVGQPASRTRIDIQTQVGQLPSARKRVR